MNIKNIIKCTLDKYFKIVMFLNNYLYDIALLIVRYNLAKSFWYSGLDKYNSWFTTQFMFKNIYNIAFLNHKTMAFLATAIELFCAILIILGFSTRIASLLLIIIISIIQLSYYNTYEHTQWLLLLLVLLTAGAGKYSLDFLISKKLFEKR